MRILRYQHYVNTKNKPKESRFYQTFIIPIIKSGQYSELEINKLIELSSLELEGELLNRIKEKYPHRIYYNLCPKCNELARTPRAKQCPNCHFRWNHAAKGAIKIAKSKKMLGGELIVWGNQESGILEIGMMGLLISHNLGLSPEIIRIEESENGLSIRLKFNSDAESDLFEKEFDKEKSLKFENKDA